MMRFNAYFVRATSYLLHFQVDFGMQVLVQNVSTWGHADAQQWVTAYELSHSNDGTTWTYVLNPLDYHGRCALQVIRTLERVTP